MGLLVFLLGRLVVVSYGVILYCIILFFGLGYGKNFWCGRFGRIWNVMLGSSWCVFYFRDRDIFCLVFLNLRTGGVDIVVNSF